MICIPQGITLNTEPPQDLCHLKMHVTLVDTYGDDLPNVLETFEAEVLSKNHDVSTADVVLSSVSGAHMSALLLLLVVALTCWLASAVGGGACTLALAR
jgi:hypothetical protein